MFCAWSRLALPIPSGAVQLEKCQPYKDPKPHWSISPAAQGRQFLSHEPLCTSLLLENLSIPH